MISALRPNKSVGFQVPRDCLKQQATHRGICAAIGDEENEVCSPTTKNPPDFSVGKKDCILKLLKLLKAAVVLPDFPSAEQLLHTGGF